MKSIELCLNRFDDITKSSFLDLYTKVDENVHEETSEVVSPTDSRKKYHSNPTNNGHLLSYKKDIMFDVKDFNEEFGGQVGKTAQSESK